MRATCNVSGIDKRWRTKVNIFDDSCQNFGRTYVYLYHCCLRSNGFAKMAKIQCVCRFRKHFTSISYQAGKFKKGLLGITGVKTTIICPNFIADTGICNEVITNFRKLTVEEVVDRTILAILREEVIVMLPLILRLTFWFKW